MNLYRRDWQRAGIITKYHGILIEVGEQITTGRKTSIFFCTKGDSHYEFQYGEVVKMQVLIPASELMEIKKL